MTLMNDNKAVIGFHMGRLIPEKPLMRRELAELGALWASGRLDPVVDSVFPFERAAEAHRRMQERRNTGKVVLSFP
jgi:NADPH:quinone reductase-like Zn-dependent oxidoreductase